MTMNIQKKLAWLTGTVAAAGVLYLAGCGQGGGGAGGSSAKALEAGLVPGADIVLRMDFKSARKAPIYATLKGFQEAKSGNAPTAELGALANKLEASLGLKEEDVEGCILSADLDSVKISPMGPDPNSMKSIQAMLAIRVAKPVTTAQLEKTITDMAVAEGATPEQLKFTHETIGGTDVMSLTPTSETDPHLHLAVLGGQTIYLGLNRQSVSGAIERAAGKPASLEPAMEGVLNAIGGDSQAKLSFVVPQVLKDSLASLGNDPNGGAGAMLSGFKDIRSISLGLNFNEGIALNLSGDMGNPDAANALNGLVSMMKPQFKVALAQQTGQKPESIPDNALISIVKENLIHITLLLSKDLITALNAK